jgi:hypothetical protein
VTISASSPRQHRRLTQDGAAVETDKPYRLKVAAYDTSDERKVEFEKP